MKKGLITALVMLMLLLASCADSSYLEKSNARGELESVSSSDKESVKATEDRIFVQIEGAVKSPGVYQMEQGDRVFALIEKAGGFRKDAYTVDINQAEPLSDGMKLIVSTKDERKQQASGTASSEGSQIDINTADSAELMTISGIGPGKAAAIIEYREQNGRFSSTEDITKVSGIGESTYKRIKDRIRV